MWRTIGGSEARLGRGGDRDSKQIQAETRPEKRPRRRGDRGFEACSGEVAERMGGRGAPAGSTGWLPWAMAFDVVTGEVEPRWTALVKAMASMAV